MGVVRGLARPMLAGVFLNGGVDTFRHPEPRAQVASPIIEMATDVLPELVPDPITAVRANAALQVGAAATLALGIMPRLSALALAGSLLPTTLGGHRFWEIEDPARRGQQRAQFLKNTAILAGLLLFAADGDHPHS